MLATASVEATGGCGGSSRKHRHNNLLTHLYASTQTHRHANTQTHRHRHSDTHTSTSRLSLVPFPFAYLRLSAHLYLSRVTLVAWRLYPAPLLIAQQHALRGRFTIFLADTVREHLPIFPPVPSRIIFLSRDVLLLCTQYGTHSAYINKRRKCTLQIGAYFLCLTDQVRLRVRMKNGFANFSFF